MDLQDKNSMSHLTAKDVKEAYDKKVAIRTANYDKIVQQIIKESILEEYEGVPFSIKVSKQRYGDIPSSILISKLKNLGFTASKIAGTKEFLELLIGIQ